MQQLTNIFKKGIVDKMKIIGTKEEIEQLNEIVINCDGYSCTYDCIFSGCNRIKHISELDKIEIEVVNDESK